MLPAAEQTLQHLGTPPGPYLLQAQIAAEHATAPTAAATNFAHIATLSFDASLGEYHLLHATRADLLRRLGRPTAALPRYSRAFELAPSDPERRFLQRRLDQSSRKGLGGRV